MSIFNTQGNLVPIHADNAKTRDWLVLLEAATIVGHERDRLRVAQTTQERKLVKRRKLFGKTEYFSLSMDMIREYTRCISALSSTKTRAVRSFL